MGRENVIKGLEQFKADFKPFCGNSADWARVEDAINLLKEQDAVEPIERNGFYYCGACRYALMTNHQKYCSDCGKKVKWK